MASSVYAVPGPRETTVQCFIKRDKTTSTFQLFLGLPPCFGQDGKFLLAARECRRVTSTKYIISEDISRESDTYVGKLWSNFLGTKFTIYDSQLPHSGVGSKQLTSRGVHSGSYKVAHIAYELNALGLRRMQCTLPTIPASAMEAGGSAPTPTEFTVEDAHVLNWSVRSKAAVVDSSALEDALLSKDEPLVLKNKVPYWHEKRQSWCLNFHFRVPAVKPIQLVKSLEPFEQARSKKHFKLVASTEDLMSQSDHDKVLLQFGKIENDMYTMNYRYPLSAFQAFAICLTSFDSKYACSFKL